MISVTIEALSGLHVGAKWSFNGGEFSIGGSSACSVFICDEGFPEVFLVMKILGRRVMIDSSSSGVEVGESKQGSSGKWLYPDQKVLVEYQGVQFSITVIDASGKLMAKLGDSLQRRLFETVESIRGIGVSLVLGLSFAMGLGTTVVVLFLGTSNASRLEAKTNENPRATVVEAPSLIEQIKGAINSELTAFAQDKNIEVFRVVESDNSIAVETQMSRKNLVNFESLLSKLAKDYGNMVLFNVKVSFTDEQSIIDQLQIRSVSLGEQPVVILRNGQKLTLGSFYESLRLVDVNENRVVFSGKSTYELPL
jgi:hypothetical protein